MKIVLVLKCFLDIEQYMLNLKCQFRYLSRRASLAHVTLGHKYPLILMLSLQHLRT